MRRRRRPFVLSFSYSHPPRSSAPRRRVARQGDHPTIYSDIDFADRVDENKGGAALLAYGATSIEFANTAVFK